MISFLLSLLFELKKLANIFSFLLILFTKLEKLVISLFFEFKLLKILLFPVLADVVFVNKLLLFCNPKFLFLLIAGVLLVENKKLLLLIFDLLFDNNKVWLFLSSKLEKKLLSLAGNPLLKLPTDPTTPDIERTLLEGVANFFLAIPLDKFPKFFRYTTVWVESCLLLNNWLFFIKGLIMFEEFFTDIISFF